MANALIEKLVALIRETASSLPDDVLKALRAAARKEEKGSSAAVVLKTILDNCALAKKQGTPLCQDTGTLTFFVDERLRRKVTPAVLKKAVALATARGYLRKNCIDSVTGHSYDDNCAEGAPVVHYTVPRAVLGRGVSKPSLPARPAAVSLRSAVRAGTHRGTESPTVTLILKGGGSENMSRQYSLPDAMLGAGRDLAGVRKCVLDAVQKIQGYGCAPGILGVCIGGDRATGYEVAKEQLLRPLDEKGSGMPRQECRGPVAMVGGPVAMVGGPVAMVGGPVVVGETGDATLLSRLEKNLLSEANTLGIGPMGLGGKTTLLGVKVASRPRVPASFFVTIAYMCWACRRRTMCVGER